MVEAGRGLRRRFIRKHRGARNSVEYGLEDESATRKINADTTGSVARENRENPGSGHAVLQLSRALIFKSQININGDLQFAIAEILNAEEKQIAPEKKIFMYIKHIHTY